jgi:outer membrane protein OmpA-like peptidoglycan-associated protein
MLSSICRKSLSRFACGALLAVLVGCAAQPPVKAPVTPPAAVPVAAHGAVTSVDERKARIRELVKSGVKPLPRSAVRGYLDALEGRLAVAIAGNTATLARVDEELVVVLPARVLFAPDAPELAPAGEKFLATLADVLRGEPALLVEADCHTDRLGNPEDNEVFTKRRADLVLATLAAHGVEAQRVLAVGSGDRFPIAENATADGRRRNRRVELSLIPVVR